MFDLMDAISELIYITDLDNYELLYMNTAGKKKFGIDKIDNLKCYKTLQGRDAPCEFCTNSILKEDDFYTWEITNEVVNRHYLLKDKIIDWEGKRARLEVAFDTTVQERQKVNLQNKLDNDSALLVCQKILTEYEELPEALNKVLTIVGTLLKPDSACICDIKEGKVQTAYVWNEPESGKQFVIPQWEDMGFADEGKQFFDSRKCTVITDIEVLRESENSIYQYLHKRGVKSLAAVSLKLENSVSGFIALTNPPVEKCENASMLLEPLSYFIIAYLQRQTDQRRLEMLSYYDTLTGLLNRNAYMRDLEKAGGKSMQPAGVLYADINGMKEMNDKYGQTYGDQILLKTAEKLKSAFPDKSVYRIGGDEFVVICRGISETDFEQSVDILKNLLKTNEKIQISIGCQWSDCGSEIPKLIMQADELMNAEKKLFYYKKAAPKRYRHRNDEVLNLAEPKVLQEMLENERFLVYLQPKVSVDSRELNGAEALVRLLSPKDKLIFPDVFITFLEETRLISMVDFYVFERVCAQIEKWIEEGKKVVPISVNFSRYSLIEKRFAKRLSEIWNCYKIPQHLIEIEITESLNVDDNEVFLSVVEHIAELGFSISIDDFGVKDANLSLFTLIPFDVLKIDKILIADLEKSKTSQIVLQSISDICRKMGIRLIAEGVETEEQLEVLREIKCEGAQGYLFDKPIPIVDFEEKYIKKA